MARKAGQIITRGASTWLVRVYLGRDSQTGTRKYLNQTIHGPFCEAQRFLNLKQQQRDNGRVSRAACENCGNLMRYQPSLSRVSTKFLISVLSYSFSLRVFACTRFQTLVSRYSIH
jgi:hypothetical protein